MRTFEEWVKVVRGHVAEEKTPMRGDWEALDEDILSLLQMLMDEGVESKPKVESLTRVAFGAEAQARIFRTVGTRVIEIHPDPWSDVCIWLEGERRAERIEICLPERGVSGVDLGWAIWLRKQMPEVPLFYI